MCEDWEDRNMFEVVKKQFVHYMPFYHQEANFSTQKVQA